MWYWLKRIFIGCDHKWVKIRSYRMANRHEHHVADQFISQCGICGKMKEETFY